MTQLEEVKKMYKDILKPLKKYKDSCVFDFNDLERQSKYHIYGVELQETYGLNINPKQISSLDYNKFCEYKKIMWYGEKYKRTIACPFDDKQPEDELLFTFWFSSGPYMFGDGGSFNKDYPEKFFQKFWLELKTYNPDYIDERNRALYWKIENAKEMFNAFDGILNKYYKLNEEDVKQRRIEKMKAELEKLQKSV